MFTGTRKGQNPVKAEEGIELPNIGDVITTKKALVLCRHLGLDHLIRRIEEAPEAYKGWKFDGCSCLPDEVMGLVTGCNWQDITYQCCLPHDLRYAYGELGNEQEREEADEAFYSDLVVKAGMIEWCASAFLIAVNLGGVEKFGLSFSWGFAHRREASPHGNHRDGDM